jgi:uncharacterized membrane protein
MAIHLFLVHFPVALLVTGAAADLAGAALRSEPVRRWAGMLLIGGALAAALAFFTGQGAAATLGRAPETYLRLESHTQWAGPGIWLLIIAGGLRAVWRKRLTGATGWATLALALLSAVLVAAIAQSGTAIAHG